jgi:Protein of unknown function (DUF2585)
MNAEILTFMRKRLWPGLVIVAISVVAALLLHNQGRQWFCSCGRLLIWVGDICSPDNSQHLLDPYSFTHILHGVAFYGLLALLAHKMSPRWKLCLAILIEALWEVVENSEYVIQRYREATAALGYHGDTVVNSLGDIAACAAGFMLARRLGLWRSVALFVVIEVMLIVWIRDSLILEVLMLTYPISAIKAWQMCA